MSTFIICGYGIPKDIATDGNYPVYLRIVFNTLYREAHGKPALIIPCGGDTNCQAPYIGNESKMIADYLQNLIAQQKLQEKTSDWRFALEDSSLSTLENLVFAKKIYDQEKGDAPVFIFCEESRAARLRTVSVRIFENTDVRVVSVDFDGSANRYLDDALLNKKEAAETESSLWVLEDPERMQKHHEFFEQKFALLRDLDKQGIDHVEAVRRWYTQAPDMMRRLMPEHPALRHQK